MASTSVAVVQAATLAELAEYASPDPDAVVKEKAPCCSPGCRLAELLLDPFEGGVAGHGDVENLTSPERHDDEDVGHGVVPEDLRREIDGPDLAGMRREEQPPRR